MDTENRVWVLTRYVGYQREGILMGIYATELLCYEAEAVADKEWAHLSDVRHKTKPIKLKTSIDS